MDDKWLSMDWFTPAKFSYFEWENPLYLYLIPLIPIIFLLRWLIAYQLDQKLTVALVKKNIKSDPISWLRVIPSTLLMLSVALLMIALARPQSTNEQTERWSEGIDIMLAIDISQSMEAEDFKPNRLEASKEVAKKFVAGRFQDRIGLVVFSGKAYSRAPLTTDYELLNTYISNISFDLIENRGTAIGSALAVTTNRLRDSKSKSKIMILLSDGENTAGNIDPLTAAKLASAYGITIYVIGIGKEGLVPLGKDFFGNTNYVQSTLDETSLRKIAEIGKGKFYRASDKNALNEIFSEIDQLEKAKIKERRYKNTEDYYRVYLYWFMLIFILWMFTKSTFFTNALID